MQAETTPTLVPLTREPQPERRNTKAEQARINGAKSRGPKTAEGKAKSSQNARKHGLRTRLFHIDPADRKAFGQFEKGLIRSLAPQNIAEELVVQNIAKIGWNLRISDNIETDLMRHNLERGDTVHSAFTYDAAKMMSLSLYQARLARRYEKLFEQLRRLKKAATKTQKSTARPRATDTNIP